MEVERRSVNMYEAKSNLSRLVEEVLEGEQVVIARAGEPVAKLVRVDAAHAPRRLGFLIGEAHLPDDFDTMGADDFCAVFGS